MAPKIVSVASELPPENCFRDDTVHLRVGLGDTMVFTEYKNLLRHYSGYFRGALSGAFQEAPKGVLDLPYIEASCFEIVHYFLHRGQLFEGPALSWEILVDIWLFGDEYIIPALQNRVLDAMVARCTKERLIPGVKVALIYQKTLPGAPLRKLLVDWIAYTGDYKSIFGAEFAKQYPHDFLVDLLWVSKLKEPAFQGTANMPPRERCHYHVHAEGEHC